MQATVKTAQTAITESRAAMAKAEAAVAQMAKEKVEPMQVGRDYCRQGDGRHASGPCQSLKRIIKPASPP